MEPKIPALNRRNAYWNKRFTEGAIYTKKPSKAIILSWKYLVGSEKILVIGGGYGRNASFLAKKGFQLTNTDISSNAIKLGRKIYTSTDNLKFKKYDILKAGKEKQYYDAAVCIYLLSLFTKKEVHSTLKNIKDMLKPDGKIICNFLSTDDDELRLAIENNNLIAENTILIDKNQLIKFYTKKQIKSVLEENNITIDKIIKIEESRYINILKKKITSRSWLVLGRIQKI